jgi:hypothetical protein
MSAGSGLEEIGTLYAVSHHHFITTLQSFYQQEGGCITQARTE